MQEEEGGLQLPDNLTCSICFRLFYDPITPPCYHSYCRGCLVKSFKKTNKLCPLCRLELHEWNLETQPTNSDIKQLLKSDHLLLYKQRKQEELEEKLIEQMTLRVKVNIGNSHQLISTQGQNSHKWTFFLLGTEAVALDKFIKDVTVYLHPTFNPNKVVLSEEPYMLTRLGWGTFELRVVVHYHPHLQKENDEFTHMLSFRATGGVSSHELEFDRMKIPGHLIVA